MSYLTADQLASMRATNEASMVDTATIKRYTTASDGAGGYTTTETTLTASVRLSPRQTLQPNTTPYAGRLAERVPWTAYFPHGTDVQESDVITVNGKNYDIIAVIGPYTNETALDTVCAEKD